MKLLIVVDMQKDFVDGALRNEEAIKIVPSVVEKVSKAYADKDTKVIFTKDTHGEYYMSTEEGKNLPVPHCIKGTDGWEIIDELKEYADDVVLKETFGSFELGDILRGIVSKTGDRTNECQTSDMGVAMENNMAGSLDGTEKNGGRLDEIELIGLCTDICVISNAMLVKAYVPNVPIYVDAACCAGVTPESHDNALAAMEQCHIHIRNKGREEWRNKLCV